MQGSVLIPSYGRSSRFGHEADHLIAPPTGPEREDDQRLRWSEPMWSPPPESRRRPHPYHGTGLSGTVNGGVPCGSFDRDEKANATRGEQDTSLEGAFGQSDHPRCFADGPGQTRLRWTLLTVRDRQMPVLRACGGHDGRGPTALQRGGDGRKLNRRVRPDHDDHLPRWQATAGGAALAYACCGRPPLARGIRRQPLYLNAWPSASSATWSSSTASASWPRRSLLAWPSVSLAGWGSLGRNLAAWPSVSSAAMIAWQWQATLASSCREALA
jgi:hypothetical protein